MHVFDANVRQKMQAQVGCLRWILSTHGWDSVHAYATGHLICSTASNQSFGQALLNRQGVESVWGKEEKMPMLC
jgi:hypothetical protein